MYNLRECHASRASDYFETVSIVLTPDNRVLITKKPHRIFHKSRTSEGLEGLASHLNYKNPQNDPDFVPFNELTDSQKLDKLLTIKRKQVNDNSSASAKPSVPDLPRPKKFTRHARQTILSVAGALEKSGYKPNNFWFFTGTLPGSSASACEGMSRYSAYALNRLKQHLRDKKLDLTFNTWEWQKRDNVRGRFSLTPALHLHLVICCPSETGYDWLPGYLKEKWFDILDDISSKSQFDLYQVDVSLGGGNYSRDSKSVQEKCTRTIQCTKSPAAYLSKYVGKGNKEESFCIKTHCKDKNIPLYYPSSWWSISKHLRSIALKFTHSFSVRVPMDRVSEVYQDFSEFIHSIATISLNRFSPEFYPDYWYQSFYLPPALYLDSVSTLESIFIEYQKTLGVRESSSMHIPGFDDVLAEWFHLSKNQYYLDDFLLSLPRYYNSPTGVDFSSGGIKHRLREYYFTKISENQDLMLPIQGF